MDQTRAYMDAQPNAPKPLTEAQRNEVRTLLKQLGASSASRRSKVGNKNPLSRKKVKRVKRIDNPFESIDEGKTVDGFTGLSTDCCLLTFVQRCRIVLLPYHYDKISLTYEEWCSMIEHYGGCKFSVLDNETRSHLKFIVEGNAPIRYLHIYLELEDEANERYGLSNFIFAT